MSPAASTKPYLIRAIHQWCVDRNYTPYVTVDYSEECVFPKEHVKLGIITINISDIAVGYLRITNDNIELAAKFSGVSYDIVIPVCRVIGVYARENGYGVNFEVTECEKKEEPAVSLKLVE